MDHTNLPIEFLSEMEKLLGAEFPEFLSSYDMPRRNGLRLNRRKISPAVFEKSAPFQVERIPWTDNGYYVDYRDMPARHPWYSAGVYYLQEPSAMAPAQILPVQPGDRVLDLCAAPGGKATELGAKLSPASGMEREDLIPLSDSDVNGEGLLVANEISSARARALLHNIEVFGIPNALVTNESPSRLAEHFPEYFDKVLVDAPCCGEGMFRKDADVVKAWYPEKVKECAAIQRQIILQAADMLRPGGFMVYSTCTFAPEENELILLHLLRHREQMELVEIPLHDGREDFSLAFSVRKLQECGYETDLTGIDPLTADLTRAVRIWPHKVQGEGHFTALLRKRPAEGRAQPAGNESADMSGYGSADVSGYGALDTGGYDRTDAADRGLKKKKTGRKDRAGRGKAQGRGNTAAGLSKEELGYLREFSGRFLPGADIDTSRLENHNGKVYLSPQGVRGVRGFAFLRNGLYLGELKKNRFEPAQGFAMALPPGTRGEERISFSAQDERTAQYLRGETVRIDGGRQNGWYLVCADGYPLGWGKLAGGQLKNKLPSGWRN